MAVVVSPPPPKTDGKFDDWMYLFWKRVISTVSTAVVVSPPPPKTDGKFDDWMYLFWKV